MEEEEGGVCVSSWNVLVSTSDVDNMDSMKGTTGQALGASCKRGDESSRFSAPGQPASPFVGS